MANTAITGIAIRGEQGESGAGIGDMLTENYDENADNIIDIAHGGSGASTPAGARAAFQLGTAATKDYPASGNAASGQVVLGSDSRLSNARTPTAHDHDAEDLTTGTIDPERLGSGSGGTGTKFLADDQTYKAPSSAPPTVYAGGTTGTAFNFNCDNGTDQRFYLDDDATLTVTGTPVDGRVYLLNFHGGAGQVLTVPATFVFHDDDTYYGLTALTVAAGKMLQILALYKATSHTGAALTGANGPYFHCASQTTDAAPL